MARSSRSNRNRTWPGGFEERTRTFITRTHTGTARGRLSSRPLSDNESVPRRTRHVESSARRLREPADGRPVGPGAKSDNKQHELAHHQGPPSPTDSRE